jgi:hypothetical protein
VLEILRIIKGEMELRDETRVVEQTRAHVALEQYRDEARRLAHVQDALRLRTRDVISSLEDLQLKEERDFAQDLEKLYQATGAMKDAETLLGTPDTGSETIAAETEAIEALLAAKRSKAGKGGGSGTTPGGSTQGGTTELASSALTGMGVGEEAEQREVEHATGTVVSPFPEEFRAGLDAYFNALEDAGG